MRRASSSNTPAHIARHRDSDSDDRHAQSHLAADTCPTVCELAHVTYRGSKLPRFLQSPAQHDHSKSLSVDRPPSAASSSASYTTNTSNSTSASSASGNASASAYAKPSTAELLTLHESQQASSALYDFVPSSPPSAYGTVRPRTRSERLDTRAKPQSIRRGRPAGDTAERVVRALGGEHDLSIAATISGSLTHGVSTAAALASSTSSNAAGKKSKTKSEDSHNVKSTSKANDRRRLAAATAFAVAE
ncbi:hypothetical protein B0H13DRAFT_2662870 [Mycena leptocephala]|nr:hypothetical protein B0H13DRAFT_2662870 [Mycena leptocephala]